MKWVPLQGYGKSVVSWTGEVRMDRIARSKPDLESKIDRTW